MRANRLKKEQAEVQPNQEKRSLPDWILTVIIFFSIIVKNKTEEVFSLVRRPWHIRKKLLLKLLKNNANQALASKISPQALA